MTEKEAKQKWCPMARLVAEPTRGVYTPPCNGAIDHTNGDTLRLKCIASDCMMWRNPAGGTTTGGCGLAECR